MSNMPMGCNEYVKSQGKAEYRVEVGQDAEDRVIAEALAIMDRRAAARADLMASSYCISSVEAARQYARLILADAMREQREGFALIYMDCQNRVLGRDVLFMGTLTQTSVYPREVVRAALNRGAAGVLLAHNHPSGMSEPSPADERLTRTLKDALALVDVAVLDHVIVGEAGPVMSFAERGLM